MRHLFISILYYFSVSDTIDDSNKISFHKSGGAVLDKNSGTDHHPQGISFQIEICLINTHISDHS